MLGHVRVCVVSCSTIRPTPKNISFECVLFSSSEQCAQCRVGLADRGPVSERLWFFRIATRSVPRSVFRETPQYPATTPQGTPQRIPQKKFSAPESHRNVPRALHRTADCFLGPHGGPRYKKISDVRGGERERERERERECFPKVRPRRGNCLVSFVRACARFFFLPNMLPSIRGSYLALRIAFSHPLPAASF